ncbi:MAG: RNA methyltransferase [Bacteroidales bacterium]|jgi:23S rRNA (guanosine2251-2'-O)-methyltransferase
MYRKLLNSELGRISADEYKVVEKSPVVLILDNIRSQHNIGSAFRTADAFAIEEIALCGICAIPPSAEIHKSALGAEESVPWRHFRETIDAVEHYKQLGYKIVSIEQTENSIMLDKFTFNQNDRYAFVFGNEVKGVQQSVVDKSDFVIEIPQFGTKHSLNVSVSLGLIVWEAAKQLKMG